MKHKKRKHKKKKKEGPTAGEALDEDDDISNSQFPGLNASEGDDYGEEEKQYQPKQHNITNLSKTRINDLNDPSYLD